MGESLHRGTTEHAQCESCPFARDERPNHPVVSEYPDDPLWILVGEGPGFNEVRLGRPFVGATGQIVNRIIAKIGRPRDQLYITNATLCQPPKDSPVEEREIAAGCCKPRLQAELAQYPGKPVLTLGAVAARALIPKDVLDAIDPPDVPKSKKRAAKDKQQAQHKEDKKRRKKIESLARKRFAVMLKYRRDQIRHEAIRANGKKPTKDYLDREVQRGRTVMWQKAWKDGIAEFDQIAKEAELRRLRGEVEPIKPGKAKKRKPIKITDIVGTLFDIDIDGTGERPLIPAIHPASLLRGGGASIGGSHTPDMAFVNIIYDAAKVDALAKGKDVRLKVNVEFEVEDRERATRLFLNALQTAFAEGSFTIDLETYVDNPDKHHALMAYVAKIRVIGIATKNSAISVMWDLLDPICMSYLQLALGKLVTGYHNALYDRTVLMAHGFILPYIGRDEGAPDFNDTLLGHHAAFPGNSHRLQTVTAQFFGVKPWKCLRGDVAVLLPDRSTISIEDFVRRRLPEVLSYENDQIVTKKVSGWHKQPSPGQEWVSIRTARCDNKYTRGLIVTPDHHVMTQRGLVEARELQPGVDRFAIDEPLLSQDQISAALGTLLGDSSLFVSRVHHKKPWEALRASVRGGHASEALRDCKVAALGLGTSGQIVPAHTRQSRGVTINASAFFAYGTKWAFQYMKLAKLVYDENWCRRIKPEALKVLDRRGLAMMFMDDGDLKRVGNFAGAGIATNGFPVEDVELFAQWLREKYGPTSIYRSRGPYCSLSAQATRNMLEDLRGYIHPSVGYKTTHNDPYRDVQPGIGIYHVAITSVDSVTRDVSTAGKRRLVDNRYCLTVEDTKLFYTNYGLVSNSEFRNAEETPDKLATYNALDTGGTHALVPVINLWIKKTKTEQVYARDKRMSDIASRMHLAGMPVDREVNAQLVGTFTRLAYEAKRVVSDKANDPQIQDAIKHHLAIQLAAKKRKADSEEFEDRYHIRLEDLRRKDWRWNANNSKHIAALLQAMGVSLFQTTEGGAISTKKDILEGLVEVPIVRDILKERENFKMLDFTAYMFDQCDADGHVTRYGFCDENDRCHPIWSIHKISGRWAGSEPHGVSNPPREKTKKVLVGSELLRHDTIILEVYCKHCKQQQHDRTDHVFEIGEVLYAERPTTKRQFKAKNGRVIVGFDFAQIEARIIALLSGDPFMCEVFNRVGGDLHTECAIDVFPGFKDRPAPERKMMRTVCKTLEYATWYGANDEKVWKGLLKEGYNFKLVDVSKSLGILRKKMSGVIRWQRETIHKASQPPYTLRDFVSGRMRIWPIGNVEASEALNIVPQSTGAAIMNMGMEKMDMRLPAYKQAFCISQVHDAAYFECWEDDAEKIEKDIDDCFACEHVREDGLSMRFTVDIGTGTSLADC